MANGNNNFEASLFNTADRLRKNIDAAEYKNVVLGLIFLKYISDSFQELYEWLEQDEFSDPEDRDEYLAEHESSKDLLGRVYEYFLGRLLRN